MESELSILRKMYLNHKNYVLNIIRFKNNYNINARLPSIPEYISESLICVMLRNAGIDSSPSSISGDLTLNTTGEKIECKCFISDGPISFGPTESWSKICLLDMRQWLTKNDYVELYLLSLASNSEEFCNIKVNKAETFKDQCNMKRRPRLGWKALHEQVKDKCSIIYKGSLMKLLET